MGMRWEILHCSRTAAQGIYSRLSEPSEYCLFMCSLLHVAWGLRAAGMPWLQRARRGWRARPWALWGRPGILCSARAGAGIRCPLNGLDAGAMTGRELVWAGGGLVIRLRISQWIQGTERATQTSRRQKCQALLCHAPLKGQPSRSQAENILITHSVGDGSSEEEQQSYGSATPKL